MKKSIILLLIIDFFFIINSFSQNNSSEIWVKLKSAQTDDQKLAHYKKLIQIYIRSDIDSFYICLQEMRPLVNKYPGTSKMASYCNNMGSYFMNKGIYDSADYYYINSMNLSAKLKDSSLYRKAALNSSIADCSRGFYVKSLKNCFAVEQKYNAYNKEDSSSKSWFYSLISKNYISLEENELGKKYAVLAITYSKTLQDSVLSLNTASDAFSHTKMDFENGLLYSTMYYNLMEKYHYKLESLTALVQMSQTYLNAKKNKEGSYYSRLLISEAKKISAGAYVSRGNILLGFLSKDSGSYNQAIKYFKSAMEQLPEPKIMAQGYSGLSSTYELMGQYDSAYYYSNEYNNLKDSIINDRKRQNILELDAIYSITENQKLIAVKEAQNEEQIKQRSKLYFLLVSLIILLLITTYFFYNKLKLSKILKERNGIVEQQAIRLLENNQLKDKLFTIIAHDLRSPINAYQGLAESVSFLLKKQKFEEIAIIAKKIDTTGKNIDMILKNLLQWGMSQQHALVYTAENIDANLIIHEVINIYKPIADAKNINLEITIDDQLQIINNRNLISVIIRNLLDNALKNSPEESKVSLNSNVTSNEFIFSISNEVKNINPENIESIKQLFNENKNWQPGKNGIGIGLTLVQQFVILMGGKMYVTNDNERVCFKLVTKSGQL